MLDFDRLEATPVATDPFPHLVVPHFVPAAELEGVYADLPKMERRGSFPIGALRFGPRAAAVLGELEGPRFRQAIARRFGIDLTDAATMMTLRGQSTERDGHIHCDSRAKRVTVLLYLNPARAEWEAHQGCLRLLRSPDLEDYAVEVPPVDGTLLVFLNGPTAWHGHKTFIGPRYVVQLNYMTSDAAARSELRRHKLSALIKRLLAA